MKRNSPRGNSPNASTKSTPNRIPRNGCAGLYVLQPRCGSSSRVESRRRTMPTTADLLQRVALLESSLNDVKSAMADQAAETDTFFLIWAGALIFLMQCGFAMLSAGSIREKNVKNILLKNLLDACMGALAWYFVGYGFAYNGPTDTVCVEPTSLAWTLLVPPRPSTSLAFGLPTDSTHPMPRSCFGPECVRRTRIHSSVRGLATSPSPASSTTTSMRMATRIIFSARIGSHGTFSLRSPLPPRRLCPAPSPSAVSWVLT